MSDAFLLLALAGTAYLGFGLFALSQSRHWQRVAGGEPLSSRRVGVLRGLGGTALTASLALALLRDGPSFGPILWMVVLSAAAIAVGLTLSRYSRA